MKIVRKSPEPAAPAAVRRESPFAQMLSGVGPWAGFFDDFRNVAPFAGTVLPETEVAEEAGAYLVKLDVPGVAKEDVEVSVSGGMLQIRAHRHTKTKEGESTMEYRRSFSLPESVKPESIEATLDKGVLSLRVPKGEAVKTRKIDVR